MEGIEDLTPIFRHMEWYLIESPFFHSSDLSMIDVSWLPLLHQTALIEKHSGYDFISPYPRLQDWRMALLDTGLAEASVPEDSEEIFTDFYLNEETYLGRLQSPARSVS